MPWHSDNRKFKTIEEHDNTLIENWNNVVGIDDIFILGDHVSAKDGTVNGKQWKK